MVGVFLAAIKCAIPVAPLCLLGEPQRAVQVLLSCSRDIALHRYRISLSFLWQRLPVPALHVVANSFVAIIHLPVAFVCNYQSIHSA